MTEIPRDRSPEPSPADVDPAETPFRGRPVFLLGLLAVLAAGLVALVAYSPGASAQEKTARRTAVRHYAELHRQSTEWVDKYCTVRARERDAGAWTVDVTRFVSPGEGGYHITTTFRVDRDGKSAFVARSEGRNE